MKHTYIKPEATIYIVAASPLLEASFGEQTADQNEQVLSKHHGNKPSFGDDFDDEEFDENYGDIEF